MRRSMSRLFLGLYAAPILLASSVASAAPDAAACNNVQLVASGSCDFEVSGGCKAKCTPLNLVAACDGKCNVAADVSCTNDCGVDCKGACDVNPGSFDCKGDCTQRCDASCTSSCTDSGCITDCQASCANRCDVQCSATPPSAMCDVQCKASCDASCQVKTNVDCHVKCSADLQGGCTAACDTPKGALFCDGQYVDVPGSVDDCINYLEGRGLKVSVSGSCDVTSGTCMASIGCSAANAVGSSTDRWGAGAIAGLMMGLGLVVSRRRRKA